jgi:hypothetical protein
MLTMAAVRPPAVETRQIAVLELDGIVGVAELQQRGQGQSSSANARRFGLVTACRPQTRALAG